MNENDDYVKKIKTELAVMMGKGRKIDKIFLSQGLTRLELFAMQQILEATKENKENKGIHVSALAKKMGIVLSSASRTLKSLEKQGLISRRIDPSNRRNVCVVSTEKGERVKKQSLEEVNLLMERVATAMGREEMDQLMVLWKRFADQVEKEVNDMMEESNRNTD